MSDHLSDAEISEVATRSDHPRAEHLDACPRCRARVLGVRAFVEPGSVPPGADPAEARERIVGAVRERLGLERPAAPPIPLPRHARRRVPAAPRWLAVAAAFVAVIGGTWLVARLGEPPVIERGAEPADGLAPFEPRVASGAVTFRWHRAPGAEGYLVRILGADLRVLHESPVTADTSRVLTLREPPLDALENEVAYWQVVALAAGAPLEESPPRPLRVR
jgi:hypothetical protein